MQDIRFKITNTESAQIEVIPVSDGVEIVVHYGEGSAKNYGSSENKPFKMYTKQSKTSPEETIEALRRFCTDKIKEEPEWTEDIKRFGKFYADKVNNGWKGELRIADLYNNWCSKRN